MIVGNGAYEFGFVAHEQRKHGGGVAVQAKAAVMDCVGVETGVKDVVFAFGAGVFVTVVFVFQLLEIFLYDVMLGAFGACGVGFSGVVGRGAVGTSVGSCGAACFGGCCVVGGDIIVTIFVVNNIESVDLINRCCAAVFVVVLCFCHVAGGCYHQGEGCD